MLIPSGLVGEVLHGPSLSRRVNANSQQKVDAAINAAKLIKKGEC